MDAEWLERWSPSSGWADYLGPVARALWSDRSNMRAWARLAMLLGDTHAPALCFAVARYGLDHCDDDDPARPQLSGHAALAALDLGFARHVEGRTKIDDDAQRRWFEETFSEIGDIERVAHFALCLAASRLHLIEGPDDPTIDDYCDLSRWELTTQ